MRYRVILPKSVWKELDRLADDVAGRILARLAELETKPRPADVKKLKGRNAWRIRVGDYRVIYEIHDRELRFTANTFRSQKKSSRCRDSNLNLKPRSRATPASNPPSV